MQTSIDQKDRVNVGRNERIASVLGGSALILGAITRPSKATFGLALSGGYLIYRGLTGNCMLYEAMDINRADQGAGGVLVERSYTILRPRREVYAFWRNFENLPRFMQHLKAVEMLDGRRSRWVAKAPLDQRVEWEAEITEEREGERIAWRSLPGAMVDNSGYVEFADTPDGTGTMLKVRLQYDPPFGSPGAVVAKLLGEEPGLQVREDLRRLKSILEAGEAPTVYGQTSGRVEQSEQERQELQRLKHKDVVQEASEESFPASDSPAWTGGPTSTPTG